MTIEQLRRARDAKPFRPFSMRLADGSRVDVPHPEFLMPHPEGVRTVAVAVPGDAFVIIDLLLVSALDIRNGSVAGSSEPPEPMPV